MAKTLIPYEDFLMSVSPDTQELANRLHSFLLENSCSYKIEPSKSGYTVSYILSNKKVVANFVFRKIGLIIRIYGDFVEKYSELLETLPDGMKKAIQKASSCKRLLDPAKCNSRCSMGYAFTLDGDSHKKCRYGSFMFPVNAENAPFIQSFLENELRERSA